MPDAYSTQQTMSRASAVSEFMRGVYAWMAAGLGITALLAVSVASSPALIQLIFGTPGVPLVLIIAQLVVVFVLAGRVNRMAASTATALFLVYSALTGVTLSTIFLVYAAATIASAFAVSAGMFLAMSIYGHITKRDLTSLGSFMFMGLIGIILASVVNMFLHSEGLNMALSYIGVFVFLGLTAYDTQRLKDMGLNAAGNDAAVVRKASILGALSLYLDFINLFLMLLRIFAGNRR